MDNIVMATLAGLPMADGKAAASAAGKAGQGLFGAIVDAEIALLAKAGRGDAKAVETNADSLAEMLLASLIQRFVREDVQEDAQDNGETNTEAGAAAVQSQGTIANSFDIQELDKIFTGNNSGNGVFERLLASGGSSREKLDALLGLLISEGSATAPAGTAAQNGNEPFAALLEELSAGTGDAGETASANPNAMKALMEIRKLFSEIISSMDVPDTDEAAQTKSAAMPQGQLTKSMIRDILAQIEALTAGKQATDGAEASASTVERPVVTLTVDSEQPAPQGETEALAGSEPELQPAQAPKAGEKKQAADFTAALRAYRGETGNATAASAPSETSAAAALRQGERAFDAIVEKITSMQNAGQKEMEIRLKPDFLGNVVIKLTMGEDGLTASIAASNPKVQDAFMSQAASLQSSLADQGLKDVRVIVTSSSVQDASLQQQQLSQGHREARQEKQKRNFAQISAAGFSTSAAAGQPLLAYEQAYRTGLVNRLA